MEQVIPRPLVGLTHILEAKPLPTTKEESVAFLQQKITDRRNRFVEDYRQHPTVAPSAVLTYDPALDTEVYKELKIHKGVNEAAHQEVLLGLHGYTRFQLETFVGERLNVGLSRYQYDIRFNEQGQGILYGQGMKESLLEMIERGQKSRDIIGSDVDKPRQEAEVVQFQKIQDVMGNPDSPEGTTLLSFSPPGKEGSVYSHNFYDVFIKRRIPGTTEWYVEARRYASGLSVEESLQKAEELSPGRTAQKEEDSADAFLLSHPVVVPRESPLWNNPDEIHRTLQKDRHALSYEQFQEQVVKDPLFCAMVGEYLRTLSEYPEQSAHLGLILNALMNRADEAVGLRKSSHSSRRYGPDHPDPRQLPPPLLTQIHQYGNQEVRKTTTGCGLSGGFGQEKSIGGFGSQRLPGNFSSFKATEGISGEDTYGKRTFDCPECHATNTRPYNELLATCQHCGTDKVAC